MDPVSAQSERNGSDSGQFVGLGRKKLGSRSSVMSRNAQCPNGRETKNF